MRWIAVAVSLCLSLPVLGDNVIFPRKRGPAGTPDIAFVSDSTVAIMDGGASGTTCTTPALAGTTVNGNFLACFMRWEGPATTWSVTADSGSNTWQNNAAAIATNTTTTPDLNIAVSYAENIVGAASHTVTFTLGAANVWRMCACVQYSGVVASSSLDTTYGTSGIVTLANQNDPTTITASTTGGAALALAVVTNASSRSVTWTGSYTERIDGVAEGSGEISAGDRIVTSATSVAAALDASDVWAMAAVGMSFKDL